MSKNELGDVRRSHVVSTHGPGSIIDFRAGGYGGAAISVVAAGLEEWDSAAPPPGTANPQTVYEPRLQKQLDVDGFRLPPVAPQVAPGQFRASAGKLVGVRFPRWMQCPKCHLIQEPRRWTQEGVDPALYCAPCSAAAGGRNRVHVVPARFIVICERGHLDEFPWDWWVGHKEGCTGNQRRLKLQGSASAGLGGLILTCLGCGAERSMEGCFARDIIAKCHGRRPWLADDAPEDCDKRARVVQRGASNLYFPVVESALDIPPWSEDLQKKIGVHWHALEGAETDEELKALIKALKLQKMTGQEPEGLFVKIKERVARLRSPDRNLRWEEYQQFLQHSKPHGQGTEFEIRPADVPHSLQGWISSITLATRLREVRALRGFTRVIPPQGPKDPRIAPISLGQPTWLPAIENRGEGIFLQLRLDRLKEWESLPDVDEHVQRIRQTYEKAWHERNPEREDLPRVITPRLLLVHSLAHALVRQLSLECGYASASLRERLYVDTGSSWEMAGMLIFTSSPDSDGTLGGLVRQGQSPNFGRVFAGALAAMSWCSSDPLCIEGVHGLSEPANGSACHACLLAAETSCEEFNAFLDRTMLIGSPTQRELGFFHGYLRELEAGQVSQT